MSCDIIYRGHRITSLFSPAQLRVLNLPDCINDVVSCVEVSFVRVNVILRHITSTWKPNATPVSIRCKVDGAVPHPSDSFTSRFPLNTCNTCVFAGFARRQPTESWDSLLQIFRSSMKSRWVVSGLEKSNTARSDHYNYRAAVYIYIHIKWNGIILGVLTICIRNAAEKYFPKMLNKMIRDEDFVPKSSSVSNLTLYK